MMPGPESFEIQPHWVYTWLDVNNITTVTQAEKKLAAWRAYDELVQLAENAHQKASPNLRPGDTAILAARGLDLSGRLTCLHIDCRRKEVDELFHHVWHYFDKIVVDDFLTHDLVTHYRNPSEKAVRWFTENLSLFIYLRQTGADRLIEFYEKPHFCAEHWRRVFEEVGLKDVDDLVVEFSSYLLRSASIKPIKAGKLYEFKHNLLDGFSIIEVNNKQGRRFSEIRQDLSRRQASYFLSSVALDVYLAAKLHMSLGSNTRLYDYIFTKLPKSTTREEVAFALELPVLRGARLEELVDFRNEERASFQRFQFRLKQAIGEALNASKELDPVKLAAQIQGDLIEPELREISTKLEEARAVFERKARTAVAMSTLVTTVGAVAGFMAGGPAAAVAGATAGTALGAAQLSAADQKRKDAEGQIEASDMWFLWEATKH